MRPRRTRRRGFTLVELLVVIAIIGVLAAMLFPSMTRVRAEGRKTICKNNLRQIGQACILYSTDWDDYFPSAVKPGEASNPLRSLSLLYDNYVSAKKIFICPSTADVCRDMLPGDSFSVHGLAGRTESRLKQTSYGYDDTKGPLTSPEVAIAADAPPAPEEDTGLTAGSEGQARAVRNSANHRISATDTGQNVLYYNGSVKWASVPEAGANKDHIYEAEDPKNPGVTDSYIHQE